MTAKEFLEKYDKGELPNLNKPCTTCGVPLQTTITGRRRSAKGEICDDCYFDALGEEIDNHPIHTPRRT